MKPVYKFLGITTLAIFFGFISNSYADPLVTESPIEAVNTAECVTISTSIFVAVPTTNWGQRIGLIVNNPKSNSGNVNGLFATSAPTESTTTAVIELEPGEFVAFSIDNGVTLFLSSQNATAEDICVQEFKQ